MTVTRRVKEIHGSPSADPTAAVLKFTFENGEEGRFSIPSDLLIGLGGMAMSFRQRHDGEMTAISVEAVSVTNLPDGQVVLVCTMGDRSMSLPLKFSNSAVRTLTAGLSRGTSFQVP